MMTLEIQIMKNKFESDEKINQLKEKLKKADDKNKFESDEELTQLRKSLKKAEDKINKIKGRFSKALKELRDSLHEHYEKFETFIKEMDIFLFLSARCCSKGRS